MSSKKKSAPQEEGQQEGQTEEQQVGTQSAEAQQEGDAAAQDDAEKKGPYADTPSDELLRGMDKDDDDIARIRKDRAEKASEMTRRLRRRP